MKTRFNTLDIISELSELKSKIIGMRVNQVYDINRKTYLIRLQNPGGVKIVLLLESGSRIHSTEFDWPKNPAPSGFSMKLRKHINNKRLENIQQIGIDRIIDITFGSGDAAYHLILELYDKGNMVLTDFEYKILNLLRPRVQGEERFEVRATYPIELAKQEFELIPLDKIKELIEKAKPNDNLKKVFLPHFEFGPSLFDHLLLKSGLSGNMKISRDFHIDEHGELLVKVFEDAKELVNNMKDLKGYIIQKKEMKPSPDGNEEEFLTYIEFHPMNLQQNINKPYLEFESFNKAVDEFFSKIESQKIDLKIVQQEKQAIKKLENVKKDHQERLDKLQKEQILDRRKAELIEFNEKLVNEALTVMRSAIANQLDWKEIDEMIQSATESGNYVASCIKKLDLSTNHFSLLLKDPYANQNNFDMSDSEDDEEEKDDEINELIVNIDIDLSAQANARKYYHQKKSAAAKEQKTLDSHSSALKSAERKTKQILRDGAVVRNIEKSRKVFWFEKFFWFISSENYLVIAGRDVQQNELLVKRYMKTGDVYVHADLHGASSVIVKNPSGNPVPPKTLNEAGQLATCYSVAWDNKVVTSAWWVESSQVSKTAPSGEYLTAGSFMIRGKKNFLPPSHLILGFGFLFKLEEGSIERHKDERKIRDMNDEVINKEEKTEDVEEEEEAHDEIPIDENATSSDEEKVEQKLDNLKLETVEEKEDQDTQEAQFPDTSIDIRYTGNDGIKAVAKGLETNETEEEQVITFTAKPRKKQVQPPKKAKGNNKVKEKEVHDDGKNVRGKKGKMKKQKDKYKDQDDEEKELRMKILQGSQRSKKNTKKNKKDDDDEHEHKKVANRKKQHNPNENQSSKRDDDDDEKNLNVNTEVDMLNSLTGIPYTEDEILFAVPVVAPYNTMTNYKFKIKITPGTGKRGKATKTALNMFLTDRNTLPREKDLLKSVKDQDLAKNLPGKVKLSAPHLQKVKSKKKK